MIRSDVDQGGQISAASIMNGPAAAVAELVAALESLPDIEAAYLEAHARRAASTFVLSDRPELAAVFDRLAAAAAGEDGRGKQSQQT